MDKLPGSAAKKKHAPKLNAEAKQYVMQALAEYKSAESIVREVYELFNLAITASAVDYYLYKPKNRERIRKMRREYLERLRFKLPICSEEYRLAELQNVVNQCRNGWYEDRALQNGGVVRVFLKDHRTLVAALAEAAKQMQTMMGKDNIGDGANIKTESGDINITYNLQGKPVDELNKRKLEIESELNAIIAGSGNGDRFRQN